MPCFNIDTEDITAFDFGNRYLFTAYFDENQLFNQLEKYYNRYRYYFKVAEEDLEEVRQILDNYFCKLVVEDSTEEYCVVANEETDTDAILRNSVMSKQRQNHGIYLMKDKLSLKQAVEQRAIQIEKSEVNAENLEWKTNGS
jgi:hypothetical protein